MPSLDVLAITSVCAHSLLTGNLVISADDEVKGWKPSKEKAIMKRGRSGFF